MYNEMFDYVKSYLKADDEENNRFPFRKRSDHIWRVFKWAERLAQEEDLKVTIDEEALLIAALFHDIGYGLYEGEGSHAEKSAKLFREYAKSHGLNEEQATFITYLIANHSDKELLKEEDIPLELVLLMEADLLDETGALAIIWDCMAEGMWGAKDFIYAYHHIERYTCKVMKENFMQTPIAKKYWVEKQDLVEQFVGQLRVDLNVE